LRVSLLFWSSSLHSSWRAFLLRLRASAPRVPPPPGPTADPSWHGSSQGRVVGARESAGEPLVVSSWGGPSPIHHPLQTPQGDSSCPSLPILPFYLRGVVPIPSSVHLVPCLSLDSALGGRMDKSGICILPHTNSLLSSSVGCLWVPGVHFVGTVSLRCTLALVDSPCVGRDSTCTDTLVHTSMPFLKCSSGHHPQGGAALLLVPSQVGAQKGRMGTYTHLRTDSLLSLCCGCSPLSRFFLAGTPPFPVPLVARAPGSLLPQCGPLASSCGTSQPFH
jgi:hypothetical protein